MLPFIAAGKTVVEWTFDKPGNLQGWQPNEHLQGVAVSNGILRFRAVARDPILQLQSPIEFKASPRQLVEIRLKADADGFAQLFWSNTTTGIYSGFSGEKTTDFRVCGDGTWRVYRLLPCWQTEGKIVRLRFDVYDGARFELDYIRITELDEGEASAAMDFDFSESGQGWVWLETETSRAPAPWNGGKLRGAPRGMMLSPTLRFDAEQGNLATVRMAASRGAYGTLYFISESQPGLKSITFPIQADGKSHTYHLDLLANTNWCGRILSLGLQPSDADHATVDLQGIKVGAAASVPPQLVVTFFNAENALPRAGLPVKLLAVVRNSGGRAATNIVARLDLPRGVKLLREASETKNCPRVGLSEEARFEWTVQSEQPKHQTFQLALTADNAKASKQSKRVGFTPRSSKAAADYVPEPKPVRGPFEVGAYYFPGWPTAGRWQFLQPYPERRPVLGWYREGDPEVADWQIKWAVEHGVTFFAYDWYWTQGKTHLEHGLHDGYFKARYRHLLKFCLLWANHNPPGTSSYEDCIAVTRYWIENYFRRPEHLTFDGKPVVIIYLPERFTDDLGRDKVKAALDAMREECRRAGLKGLYLTACVSDAGVARLAAAQGYDAVTAYTWPGSGMVGEGMFAPFETLVPAYRRKWENLATESPIPLAPVLVCGGWDSRPWHGDQGLVRFGRTPDLFKQHLREARAFLETSPAGCKLPKMMLVEAWNEWCEGSYIEPHQQFGFEYLDAIRNVLTDAPKAHAETTPADVDRGPYAVAAYPTNTSWAFESGCEGWHDGKEFPLAWTNGALLAEPAANAPAFFSPPMQARAGDFQSIVIRMKLTRADHALFSGSANCAWYGREIPFREAGNIAFAVQGDGLWHEYRIPTSQNPRWRAMITRLRLTPCGEANTRAEVDYVRLAE